MLRFASLAVLICALPTIGLAHDLWLEREGAGYALYQGHRHSAHSGAEVVPYEPAAAKGALCRDAAGTTRPLAAGRSHPARFAGDCTALLATFSTGYWTKTPWETRNVPKAGSADVLKSWLSEESVKRIDRWTAGAAQPFGSGLEITPLHDPFQVAVDDKLTVLVTDGGKPLAGVPVAYQGDTRGITGPDGRIAIRLRRTGVQLISVSTEAPLADGKADVLIRATALQFELRP